MNINMSNQKGISIICGTDRHGSNSERVARTCEDLLKLAETPSQLLLLRDLPLPEDRGQQYGAPKGEVKQMIEAHIANFDKFLFIVPEYNGSFPGILKLFIDLVPPAMFYGKKAALVGVSDGRAGNLRGLDHLTSILNYVRMDVLWHKPKLSAISSLLEGDGSLQEETRIVLEEQMEMLLDHGGDPRTD